MFDYITLQDLIDLISKGSKIHINVLFFDKSDDEYFYLHRKNEIHTAPFCDFSKRKEGGLKRCLKCKYFSVEKALREKKPFSGFCINGIFEYVYPVVIDSRVAGIVYVGNIIFDDDKFAEKNCIDKTHPILDTIEYNPDLAEIEKIARLVESYIHMLYEKYSEKLQKSHSGAVDMLKAYIDTYFSNDIRLSQIAKIYHFNEKYLGRLFIKQTGISFKEYLNEKRLKNACKLLKIGQESIVNIALKSGFNNVTYFNRVFKNKFGITPKEYAAKYLN